MKKEKKYGVQFIMFKASYSMIINLKKVKVCNNNLSRYFVNHN